MTVSTTHVNNSFLGDGVATVFNFTFQVQKVEDIQVAVDDDVVVDGISILLNANQKLAPGGNVTFDAAPDDEIIVNIERVTEQVQNSGFTLEGKIDTAKLEFTFDRMVMMLQEAASRTQGQIGPQGPAGPTGPAGNIAGPASSTNNALAIWNGGGGNVLKNGPEPVNNGDVLKVVGGVWAAAAAAATFPSGTIILWDTNLAAIPTGWAAMDGQTVTINGVSKVTLDTRGKYLMCAAVADSGSSGYTGATVRPGTVSGTKTHQHAQGGAVTNSYDYATGSISSGAVLAGSGGFAAAQNGTISFTPAPHSHSASLSGNVQANTEDQRPIEAALLLIVKVD